jgi:hypothetical protein
MAIDVRHIDWMYDVLQFGFCKCLEIGSHKGSSTTAFLESVLNGSVAEFHISEIDVLPELERAIGDVPVTLHRERGVDILRSIPEFDFVFIDANHTYEAVSEEVEQLLRHGTETVMGHDSNATACGIGAAEGGHYLKQVFSGHPDYYSLEENMSRQNEMTHRGMFFATKNPDLWKHAKTALRRIQ